MDKSWLVQLTTVSMRFEWASQLETAGNDNFSFDREEARLRLVRFVRITLPVLIKVRAISRKVSSVKYVVSGKQREFPIERERLAVGSILARFLRRDGRRNFKRVARSSEKAGNRARGSWRENGRDKTIRIARKLFKPRHREFRNNWLDRRSFVNKHGPLIN